PRPADDRSARLPGERRHPQDGGRDAGDAAGRPGVDAAPGSIAALAPAGGRDTMRTPTVHHAEHPSRKEAPVSDKLVLYTGEKNVSSWSMRGYLAVVEKEVPFEERPLAITEDKDRSGRRAVSPTGKVPVLHHGDRVIPDSLAILEYLEETFMPPKYKALWPSDPGQRAHARWLAAAMHSGFMKLRESMSF